MMITPDSQFAFLGDPRLAAHALNSAPVWLWDSNAERILWANPSGAAIFDARSPAAATSIHFELHHPTAAQISRLAGTLPQGGAPRLERLRGFGAGIGATLICLCSRITLANNNVAILVVSTERAGPNISLPERVSRLLDDVQDPAAIFAPDGELIGAQAAADALIGSRRDLTALGAEKLAREASLNGSAEGDIPAGHVSLLKLGANSSFGLLVVFGKSVATSQPKPTTASIQISAPATVKSAEPIPSHHLPFRFVWQTDAATRFSLTGDEFSDLLGPKTAAVLDRNWSEIAQALHLDAESQIANALTARETFSGIVLFWPLDDTDARLAVEMSGLPIFGRDRQFKGFRGFGICRDGARVQEIQRRPGPQNPRQRRSRKRKN